MLPRVEKAFERRSEWRQRCALKWWDDHDLVSVVPARVRGGSGGSGMNSVSPVICGKRPRRQSPMMGSFVRLSGRVSVRLLDHGRDFRFRGR